MSTLIATPAAAGPLPLPPLDSDSASVNIPLSKIIPSKTNPGRAFDPERDGDTVGSIRIHGVLQPILLRPAGVKGSSFQVKDHYEIVAGERRFHCSIKAGRASIPAVIRRLTDVEALEIQTIENDQREDLDAMGKALAFRRLWEAYSEEGIGTKERVERMSQRLARKPRTVWNVLSLGSLIADGQKLLREEQITLSHAYEICRRPAKVQKEILEWLDEEMRYGDAPSVRDLKQYIREECDRFLDSAPFDKKSATLVETAGPCSECQKNTAVNPNLVDEADAKGKHGGKSAICTDRECWNQKVQANLVQIEKASKEKGKDIIRVSRCGGVKGAKDPSQWREAKPDSCPHCVEGIIVDEGHEGEKIIVCFMTNLCKVHFGAGASIRRAPVLRPRSDAEKKSMLLKQRNKKADQAYRAKASIAFAAKVKELKHADLQEVALRLYDLLDRRLRNPVCATMGWKISDRPYYGAELPTEQFSKLTPAQLSGFISLLTVADKILPAGDYYGPISKIKADGFAKRHKIDLAKIEKDATAPLRQRWAEIDARKKSKVQTSARRKGAAA